MAKRIQVWLILQLHNSGISQDDIASSQHMSKSSISKVLAVAREKNITYADIQGMDDLTYKEQQASASYADDSSMGYLRGSDYYRKGGGPDAE